MEKIMPGQGSSVCFKSPPFFKSLSTFVLICLVSCTLVPIVVGAEGTIEANDGPWIKTKIPKDEIYIINKIKSHQEKGNSLVTSALMVGECRFSDEPDSEYGMTSQQKVSILTYWIKNINHWLSTEEFYQSAAKMIKFLDGDEFVGPQKRKSSKIPLHN